MLNRQQILALTESGLDVFERYLGFKPKPGLNFQNPFVDSKQETPSFNVYQDRHGEWRYKDFAVDGDNGSCIDLVMRLHNCDANEAMQRIGNDLNLVGEAEPSYIIHQHEPPGAYNVDKYAEHTVCSKPNFDSEDVAFWAQYGIPVEVLEKNGVAAVESYCATKRDGTTYTVRGSTEQPIFSYQAAAGQWKIYRPKPKSFCWVGGQPQGYVFGLNCLPTTGDLVILAAGEKDAMCLQAHGYPAISLSSETALPPDGLLERLQRFSKVLVCYDTDKTGREQSAKLSRAYGWGVLELPAALEPYGKDVSDFFRAVGQGRLQVDLFTQALNSARQLEAPLPIPATTEYPTWSGVFSLGDLLGRSTVEVPKLVSPIFQRQGVACLAGSSDTGKSSFLRQLSLAVAMNEEEFLGFKLHTIHQRAIYVSTEDGDEAVAAQLQIQLAGRNVPPAAKTNLRFVFDTPNLVAKLDAMLTNEPADLVVVDALGDLYQGNMNSSNEVRSFVNSYHHLAVKHDCLVLFMHHTGKRAEEREPSKNNLLGSQGLEAKMRVVCELRVDSHDPNVRHLCVLKGNYLPTDVKQRSYALSFKDLCFQYTGERAELSTLVKRPEDGLGKPVLPSRRDELLQKARELREGGSTLVQIEKVLASEAASSGVSGLSKSTLHRELKTIIPKSQRPAPIGDGTWDLTQAQQERPMAAIA
ncbi:AAA family ATPase [Hymenobacter busanensis]|uniref:AAA family ATPase n=1 Tax=Hymenobacter busanensis TaxID=2607656 RepID=A0A7L4ZWH8_9BACT|nr:bifunctional DNA primase/helicase [Hymenobacter busanensis]KAA9332081.1 AAA family ATPase [Hymenobacter busanensis]QHJ07581.1 AAA family ATPase [Hymenobacter busanensis]